MQSFGLYTHIRSNQIRSVFLLAGLFVLLYVMLFAIILFLNGSSGGGQSFGEIVDNAVTGTLVASPFATLAAGGWIAFAYFNHQKLIDRVTKSAPVTREQNPKLYNLLENLCVSRGLTMPRLEVSGSPALNAFATGLNDKQYSITVTKGLLDALDDAELEAVLAHELTHIRNRDVQVMVIAAVMAGIVGFVCELLFRGFFNPRRSSSTSSSSTSSSSSSWSWGRSSSSSGSKRGGKDGGGGALLAIVVAVVLMLIAWLLSQVIRYSLSRKREYMADAGAVELTKNPDAMIAALRKIEGKGEIEGAPSGVMEMCLDNPRQGFVDLFATHPSIGSRVEALQRYAGGREDLATVARPVPPAESGFPGATMAPPAGSGPASGATEVPSATR